MVISPLQIDRHKILKSQLSSQLPNKQTKITMFTEMHSTIAIEQTLKTIFNNNLSEESKIVKNKQYHHMFV